MLLDSLEKLKEGRNLITCYLMWEEIAALISNDSIKNHNEG